MSRRISRIQAYNWTNNAGKTGLSNDCVKRQIERTYAKKTIVFLGIGREKKVCFCLSFWQCNSLKSRVDFNVNRCVT